mmetsp:Transcript_8169/g.24315  ORF Transcript_8169/g.24315 Transcript_8169/m.24315 type:complete len:227 (-) Transcript_8169:1074-1754(-)
MGRDSTRGRLDRRTGVQGRSSHGPVQGRIVTARAHARNFAAFANRSPRGPADCGTARAAVERRVRCVGLQCPQLYSRSRFLLDLQRRKARSEPRLPPPGPGGHELASLAKLLSAPALNVLSPCPSCGLSRENPMQRFLFVATLVAALPTPRRRVRAPSRIRSSPRGGGGRIADSRSTTLPRDSRSTILPRGAAAIASSRSRSSRRRRASTAALTKTQENRITQARY